jgi:hypothetical protein
MSLHVSGTTGANLNRRIEAMMARQNGGDLHPLNRGNYD